VALVAVLGGAGGQAATSISRNSATFQDAVGEDPEAPDITSVVVANDATGEVTFRISVPNRPTLTKDMRVSIKLDWDDSAATGLTVDGQKGVDLFILVDPVLHGLGNAAMGGCSGNTCATGPQPDVLRFAYEGGVARFALDTSRFEVPLKRFRFRVQAQSGAVFDEETRKFDFTNWRTDLAPTNSQNPTRAEYWVYESRPVIVKSFSRAPMRPQAGKPFALTLTAIRTDAGTVARAGTVSCAMRLGKGSLRARSSGFVRRQATCGYAIPANAMGKRYRATISVRVNGTVVSRSVSGRIG
jgi:hypothetical protein